MNADTNAMLAAFRAAYQDQLEQTRAARQAAYDEIQKENREAWQAARKGIITALRLIEHKSIGEIIALTGIPKATVSYHCKGLRPNNARNANTGPATVASAAKNRRKREEAVAIAKQQWTTVKTNPTVMALIAFYWSEGRKRISKRSSHAAGFGIANSDPGVVAVCGSILRDLGHTELRIRLKIMPEQDVTECKTAWEKATGLPVVGVTVGKRRGQHTRIWSKYGVACLEVRKATVLWLTIMTWIDCWRREHNLTENWQL
jgi:hypothetical protein